MTAGTRTAAWDVYDGPLGPLTLERSPRGLTGLAFSGRDGHRGRRGHDRTLLAPALGQLEEYFAGTRRTFDLRLDLAGTPFQRAVWEELERIPFGSTVTYTELAHRVGRPGAVRAVAATVARTPVPIVVPCHRVIGADGRLTGYLGGLHRKRALLDLEHAENFAPPAAATAAVSEAQEPTVTMGPSPTKGAS